MTHTHTEFKEFIHLNATITFSLTFPFCPPPNSIYLHITRHKSHQPLHNHLTKCLLCLFSAELLCDKVKHVQAFVGLGTQPAAEAPEMLLFTTLFYAISISYNNTFIQFFDHLSQSDSYSFQLTHFILYYTWPHLIFLYLQMRNQAQKRSNSTEFGSLSTKHPKTACLRSPACKVSLTLAREVKTNLHQTN